MMVITNKVDQNYLLDKNHLVPVDRLAEVQQDILGHHLMERNRRLNILQVVAHLYRVAACLPSDSLLLQLGNLHQQGALHRDLRDTPQQVPHLGIPSHQQVPLLGIPYLQQVPLLGNSTIILVISENNIIVVSSLFIENQF